MKIQRLSLSAIQNNKTQVLVFTNAIWFDQSTQGAAMRLQWVTVTDLKLARK
jgi:hypothetical protein